MALEVLMGKPVLTRAQAENKAGANGLSNLRISGNDWMADNEAGEPRIIGAVDFDRVRLSGAEQVNLLGFSGWTLPKYWWLYAVLIGLAVFSVTPPGRVAIAAGSRGAKALAKSGAAKGAKKVLKAGVKRAADSVTNS